MSQSLWNTISNHIWKNHRNYLWAIFSFVILSLFWDWVPTMVKVIALIVATIGFLFLILTSNKMPKVMAYIANNKVICIIIACILVIPLEGVLYRDNLVSFFSKTPSQNLYIAEDFNPSGWLEPNVCLIEFGVRADELDPVEITIDTGNFTPEHVFAWFDRPHMVFQTNNSIPITDTSGKFLTTYQATTKPMTFSTITLPLSPQRSFYIELASYQPFIVKTIVFGGKHFHIEGIKWVLDNP